MTIKTLVDGKRRPYKKRRCDSKYKDKYTKELKSGIRYKEGLSKIELCHRWRISDNTFDDWLVTIPEFREAYQLSKSDYAAYWHEINKKVAKGEIKGNPACVVFALTNIEKIHWSSRVEVNSKSEQSIGAININILEAPKRVLQLEDNTTSDIIEGEIVADNVVKIYDRKQD